MKRIVRITKSFKRQAKPLLKKYSSLNKELFQLEKDLILNPETGTFLGHNSFKIRLAVKSKGKGKRGGLRVISHITTEVIGLIEKDGDTVTINLISIYDKGETANITEKELKELINQIQS